MGTVGLTLFWVLSIFLGVGANIGIGGSGGVSLAVVIFGLFFIVGTLGIGFLPMWIALARGHQDRVAIILLNIFADWTIAGWIAALVWSATAVRR